MTRRTGDTRSASWVASFPSTHDAMLAEVLCAEARVPGRIIPLPVQIDAGCGLAWKMPREARESFEAAMAGRVAVAGYHLMEL
ncbi:MAG: DUF3343 domain-containing protein [Collinsella sp.]|nr:DUF3343 domain-containing protein [Collinsella sp.]